MKLYFGPMVEAARIRKGPLASARGDRSGVFVLEDGPRVIVSSGSDWAAAGLPGPPWEHASVSHADYCPAWDEMCWVKDLFWEPEEPVIQMHPPKSEWVNVYPNCLHLWKPVGIVLPRPPKITV